MAATPPPEDPRLRAAWELGRAPFDPEEPLPAEVRSWGHEEHEAFRAGVWSQRSRQGLRAPVGWPTQAALLVLRAALLFGAESVRERSGWIGESLVGALFVPVVLVEQRLERRQADRLRLEPETAPRLKVGLWGSVPSLLFSVVAWMRGYKVAAPRPPVALAQQIVAEIDRRRSWRAALAAGR